MKTSEQGVNVGALFKVDIQYQVPRYQRRYVWNETNWRTLWEDILSQLDLELVEYSNGEFVVKQREQRENMSDKDGGHFTGPFVIRPIGSGNLNRCEVIDGQQRLITFQIILCVIRDRCQSQDSAELAELADEVDQLIVNSNTVIRRNVSEPFPDPTYKFRSTDYDRSAFEAIAEGQYGKVIPQAFDEVENRLQSKEYIQEIRSQVFDDFKDVSDNVLGAYDYFYEQIQIYAGETCDYKKIDGLISSIKNKFELAQITLDSSDQPEEIFESLNATGRKLSEFDYLRNNLFLRAGELKEDENGTSYSDIYYDKYWHFENNFHYWNIDRLESFLRMFLFAKLGPYCFQSDKEDGKDRKAFEVYQKQYFKKIKGEEIEHEFSELRRYAKVYQEVYPYNIDERKSEIGRRMQFYDDLKITNLLPFILHLKNEVKISDSALGEVCNILESYLVRRMVHYGHGTNHKDEKGYAAIDEFFSKLIEYKKFNIQEFVRSLSAWPDNSAILGDGKLQGRDVSVGGLQRTANDTDSNNRPLTQNPAWSLLRYIFYRIEQHITEDNTLRFGDFLSNPTRILPEPPKHQSRADWLSIGNLTFREKNDMDSDWVNNLSFDNTKNILLDGLNAQLELNREICEEYNSWDVRQIRRRQETLSNRFCAIWPDKDSFLAKISKSNSPLTYELKGKPLTAHQRPQRPQRRRHIVLPTLI